MDNCTIANRKITYELVITVMRTNGLLSNREVVDEDNRCWTAATEYGLTSLYSQMLN